MITEIRLGNFRAFQSLVHVRIRPITVLIGKNSAGKSSLIKFLQMLRQTLESKSDQFFVTDGKEVSLGAWRDVRNTNTSLNKHADPYMWFYIGVRTEDLPSPDQFALWKAASSNQFVAQEGDKIRVALEFTRQSHQKIATVGQFAIRGQVAYQGDFRTGSHSIDGIWEGGEKLAEKFSHGVSNLARTAFLRFAERSDSISSSMRGLAAEPFLETLRQEFLRPKFLSPIREESRRAIQTSSPPPRDVGNRGEYAIAHLAEILKNPGQDDRFDFIMKHARLVAHVDKIGVTRTLGNALTSIWGRNPDTRASCLLADFGFGVSQCVPIFIQGAMQQPGELLVVEQPEAHLHPSAQIDLGSFFAELWTERKVPSLIETHSPNIILRLRKLISQGKLKADDVSVAYFTTGTNSKRKRNPDSKRSNEEPHFAPTPFPVVVVKNLGINPDGSLGSGEDVLPMEFFGADIMEALDFGEETDD